MALPLPRVGRQLDPPRRARGRHPATADRPPTTSPPAPEHLGLGAVGAQRGEQHRLRVLGQAAGTSPAASAAGRARRSAARPPRAAPARRRRSAPPPARAAPSTPRVADLGPASAPADVAAPATSRRPVRHRLAPPPERLQHRLHQRRVERVRHLQPLRVARPRAANAASDRLTAAASPAITTSSGPLTAAIDTVAACARDRRRHLRLRRRDRRPSPRPPAAPASAARARRPAAPRPRARTRPPRTPPRTRPRCAPPPQSGCTPHDRHSSASAYSQREQRRLRVAGLVEQRGLAAPGSAHITSRSGRSRCASQRRASTASSASRNTGHAAYSPRPIPAYCAPWPGEQEATLACAPPDAPRATPRGRLAARRCRERVARAPRASRATTREPMLVGARAPSPALNATSPRPPRRVRSQVRRAAAPPAPPARASRLAPTAPRARAAARAGRPPASPSPAAPPPRPRARWCR